MLLIFILIHLTVSPVSRGFSSKVHSIVVLLMHDIHKYFVDKSKIFHFSIPFSNKPAVPNFDLQSKYFLKTKFRLLFTPSASFELRVNANKSQNKSFFCGMILPLFEYTSSPYPSHGCTPPHLWLLLSPLCPPPLP